MVFYFLTQKEKLQMSRLEMVPITNKFTGDRVCKVKVLKVKGFRLPFSSKIGCMGPFFLIIELNKQIFFFLILACSHSPSLTCFEVQFNKSNTMKARISLAL